MAYAPPRQSGAPGFLARPPPFQQLTPHLSAVNASLGSPAAGTPVATRPAGASPATAGLTAQQNNALDNIVTVEVRALARFLPAVARFELIPFPSFNGRTAAA